MVGHKAWHALQCQPELRNDLVYVRVTEGHPLKTLEDGLVKKLSWVGLCGDDPHSTKMIMHHFIRIKKIHKNDLFKTAFVIGLRPDNIVVREFRVHDPITEGDRLATIARGLMKHAANQKRARPSMIVLPDEITTQPASLTADPKNIRELVESLFQGLQIRNLKLLRVTREATVQLKPCDRGVLIGASENLYRMSDTWHNTGWHEWAYHARYMAAHMCDAANEYEDAILYLHRALGSVRRLTNRKWYKAYIVRTLKMLKRLFHGQYTILAPHLWIHHLVELLLLCSDCGRQKEVAVLHQRVKKCLAKCDQPYPEIVREYVGMMNRRIAILRSDGQKSVEEIVRIALQQERFSLFPQHSSANPNSGMTWFM